MKFLSTIFCAAFGVIGVGLFCIFVAAEEISWGQRLFAFKPPNYFLEMNYQQELNVHNLLKKKELAGFSLDSRYLVTLVAVLYGLVLVALARILKQGRLADAISAIAPPAFLVPWFIFIALVELAYPVKFAGEAAEFVLGLLFLIAVLYRGSPKTPNERKSIGEGRVLSGLVISIVLGLITPSVLDATLYASNPDSIAEAQTELQELRHDILQEGVITKRHKK